MELIAPGEHGSARHLRPRSAHGDHAVAVPEVQKDDDGGGQQHVEETHTHGHEAHDRQHGEHWQASNCELFFDLAYVVIIHNIAAPLEEEEEHPVFPYLYCRVMLMISTVWALWSMVSDFAVSSRYFAEAKNRPDAGNRLTTFAASVVLLAMIFSGLMGRASQQLNFLVFVLWYVTAGALVTASFKWLARRRGDEPPNADLDKFNLVGVIYAVFVFVDACLLIPAALLIEKDQRKSDARASFQQLRASSMSVHEHQGVGTSSSIGNNPQVLSGANAAGMGPSSSSSSNSGGLNNPLQVGSYPSDDHSLVGPFHLGEWLWVTMFFLKIFFVFAGNALFQSEYDSIADCVRANKSLLHLWQERFQLVVLISLGEVVAASFEVPHRASDHLFESSSSWLMRNRNHAAYNLQQVNHNRPRGSDVTSAAGGMHFQESHQVVRVPRPDYSEDFLTRLGDLSHETVALSCMATAIACYCLYFCVDPPGWRNCGVMSMVGFATEALATVIITCSLAGLGAGYARLLKLAKLEEHRVVGYETSASTFNIDSAFFHTRETNYFAQTVMLLYFNGSGFLIGASINCLFGSPAPEGGDHDDASLSFTSLHQVAAEIQLQQASGSGVSARPGQTPRRVLINKPRLGGKVRGVLRIAVAVLFSAVPHLQSMKRDVYSRTTRMLAVAGFLPVVLLLLAAIESIGTRPRRVAS
ncbi:unnamed protein product [Amoebophrya sp. A25]|nr:unnamed protein product [Amoebophrya sp. A25]|eukprot:GSA25T00015924001.1